MLRIGFSVLLWLLASHGAHGYPSFSDVRTIRWHDETISWNKSFVKQNIESKALKTAWSYLPYWNSSVKQEVDHVISKV